jgi:ribosomal protein L37E
MAKSRYAFYVRDPNLTSDQLKAALQAHYSRYRVSMRRVFVNVIAPAKDSFVVRVDKSVFTRVEVTLHTDHIVTVIPVTGSLGCLIGWARFLFLSPKLATEVCAYLNATFGETNHLVCPRCGKQYAHFYNGCPKCGITFQQQSQSIPNEIVPTPSLNNRGGESGSQLFCGRCGKGNLAESKFCYACGGPIISHGQPQPKIPAS